MRARTAYVCQACGHQEAKWMGRCPGCDAWSTLIEEVVAGGRKGAAVARPQRPATLLGEIAGEGEPRRSTAIPELDRVLGGGLVHGGLVLVGGDPGIGKSTLLLQALGKLAQGKRPALYVSAEESLSQIKLRADRLDIQSDCLFLLAETDFDAIDATRQELKPDVMVIDSIQTVGLASLDSAVGSVAQIRAVTARLMQVAKGEGCTVFVAGHVTKEGTIAGPRVMEHMVDTVLYFEGERTGPYRILRAHKNRFGSAQEIGVFEMHADGLRPVTNPSELFLSQRAQGAGAAVVSSLEGSRPILLEVQALTAPALYGTPRRTTTGFDPQRVAMLCAVLDRRAGVDVAGLDVYVNVAGGVRLAEPAADLGVLLALASSVTGVSAEADSVIIGEVGLSGEVRNVSQLPARVAEAAALGFSRCIVPQTDLARWRGPKPLLPLDGVETVAAALDAAGLRGPRIAAAG